jgi:hypothetical protein
MLLPLRPARAVCVLLMRLRVLTVHRLQHSRLIFNTRKKAGLLAHGCDRVEHTCLEHAPFNQSKLEQEASQNASAPWGLRSLDRVGDQETLREIVFALKQP